MYFSIKPNNILKSNGYLFHVISLGIIFARLVYPLAFKDMVHIMVVLFILIPPGLYLLDAMKNVKMSFPTVIGAALAIGLMCQGLLYFIMTIAYIPNYYPIIAISISVISLAALLYSRKSNGFKDKVATFDFVDLVLYTGLFLGLSLFSSTYGNLFDSSITEGLIETPLLERHSSGFANYALNYSEYPFFSIFGWPIIPVEIPYKIPHLPMAGFLVKSLSVWCGYNILLGLYLTHLLVFISLVFTAVVICSLLFNRYAALLVPVAFSLHFMPIDRDYLIYLPVLISLMGAEIFILTIMNQENKLPENNYRLIILLCIITSFITLVHNQFLMVFSLAMIIYLLYSITKHGFFISMKLYIFPIMFLLIAFYIALLQNKALYPSLYSTDWDQRRAVIELDLFQNIGYIYPSIYKDLTSLFKTIFRFDFLLIVCGIISLFTTIHKYKWIHYKSTHMFIGSGILISLLFGNIFNFKAGNSSILFLTFGIYFLTIYGGEMLSRKRIVALLLTLVLIIGYFLYPQFYRFWYSGNGSTLKQDYIALRKISDAVPYNARLLLLSDTFINFYIGYNDEPEPKNYERRTQRACEMFTARRCVFQKTSGNLDENYLNEVMHRKIMTYKLTHILTDDPGMMPNHIGSGISIVNRKQLAASKDKIFYVGELRYDSHFY